MESQNGLGKLLPKSLSARRKQRSKKAKSRDGDAAGDATSDRPVSSGNLSLYADDRDGDDDREYMDDQDDDGSFASYESSVDANHSAES